MRTAINIVCLSNKSILLVKKKEVWILPGGKPLEGETDLECLLRECDEELPKASFITKEKYGDFIGKTPFSGNILMAKVYFGEVSGEIRPAAEISDAQFIPKDKLSHFPLSEITKKIIVSLIKDGLL